MKKKITNKNKKKFSKKGLIFLTIMFIIILVISFKKNDNNSQKISLIINNEDITSSLQNEVIIKGQNVYLSLEDIKKCIDSDAIEENNTIILSSDKKIAALKINNSDIEINGSTVEINGQAFKVNDKTIYIPISELKNVYDMEFNYIPEYKNIVIDYYSNELIKAKTKKNVSLKQKDSNFSKTLEKIKKDTEVIIVSSVDGGKWVKVRSQNGNIGYIKAKKLSDQIVERDDFKEESKDIKNISFEKDITKENISNYKNRKKVIEDILLDTVTKKQKAVKIIYNKKDNESLKRFKIESTAILKECGITVVFSD